MNIRDHLSGTAVYGEYDSMPNSTSFYSAFFNANAATQLLITTTDYSYYIVTTFGNLTRETKLNGGYLDITAANSSGTAIRGLNEFLEVDDTVIMRSNIANPAKRARYFNRGLKFPMDPTIYSSDGNQIIYCE